MALKETPSEPKQAAQTTTGRQRLESCVLEELWSIWHADPRVPSINSRRSWAISRNANPRLVDGWFLRRRTYAKKAGQPISDDSYELPLDPDVEHDSDPAAIPSPLSDDTLVSFPDVQDDYLHNIKSSSDAMFDKDVLAEPKWPKTTAYNRHEHDRPEPIPSPADFQGRGKQSHFTRILCSSTPQDLIPSGFSAASDDPSVRSSRPAFSPELSAIPFLFRTPATVFSANTASRWTVDDSKSIEDELERLVNDGELDFSFLEDPQLACMELVD